MTVMLWKSNGDVIERDKAVLLCETSHISIGRGTSLGWAGFWSM
jgi:hypothetical protein